MRASYTLFDASHVLFTCVVYIKAHYLRKIYLIWDLMVQNTTSLFCACVKYRIKYVLYTTIGCGTSVVRP